MVYQPLPLFSDNRLPKSDFMRVEPCPLFLT